MQNSSADMEHEAWTEYAYKTYQPFQHFAFIYQGKGYWFQTHDGVIRALGNSNSPNSIKVAYENGIDAVNVNIEDTKSNPQLDDNFNGRTEEDGDNSDGNYASKIYL